MFERYTEKARRVIFFGRYEASQFGSPYIESEHILLGVLREDKLLTQRFLPLGATETVRVEIQGHTTVRGKTSTSVDLPISDECKRVFAYAAEEAERLNQKHIGTEHLLLGLLREEKCFAAKLLMDRGVRLQSVREELILNPHEHLGRAHTPGASRPEEPAASLIPVEPLHPLIGRQDELDRILHILGCFNGKNPVLVGELGVGKRTIVGGLVQHITDGVVPPFLAEKSVMELSPPPWGAVGSDWFDKFHRALPKAAERGTILFVDDLHTPVDGVYWRTASHLQEILKRAIVGRQIRCISVATPGGYAKSITDNGWLDACFQPIQVLPASEGDSVKVLRGIKQIYEEFHTVTYSDGALVSAVAYAKACIAGRHLPGKAVDVIDEAGSCAKVRRTPLPEDVVEVQKRIAFIVQRMAAAIKNHDFEKARFYSDEERKERENLRMLHEKHKMDATPTVEVTREDIEGVVARWTGATVEMIRRSRTDGAGETKPTGR
jgi:ATP-dependent Clp protease ATP-binding subunit ClpC